MHWIFVAAFPPYTLFPFGRLCLVGTMRTEIQDSPEQPSTNASSADQKNSSKESVAEPLQVVLLLG